jgi:hypothetical protein
MLKNIFEINALQRCAECESPAALLVCVDSRNARQFFINYLKHENYGTKNKSKRKSNRRRYCC